MLTTLVKSVFLSVLLAVNVNSIDNNEEHDWDLFIFTERWPITSCIQFEESLGFNFERTCTAAGSKTDWSIHGIWPTKLGTEGPAFCDHSLKFNNTALNPIRAELLDKWFNIEGGKSDSSLWQHEWTKHGTCAVSVFDNELKYFQQGLDWLNKFNLTLILQENGIVPSTNAEVHVVDIHNAVKKYTGKNPRIQCIHETESKKAYIFEIRICFDKSLNLADCDGTRSTLGTVEEIITNCPLDETLTYPSTLHTVKSPKHNSGWSQADKYKFLRKTIVVLKFLQWITL